MPEKKCYQSNMAERVYKPPLADRWRETLRLPKPGRDRDFQIIRFRLT